MFKLDDNFLNELGLGALPPAEKNKMLAHIYETLEMRVGMRLAEKMTNEQLDEFEAYINKNDEAGALKWLETNFPNYKEVVAEELEKLKAEIRQVAPQIVAQAQQNAQMADPSSAQQVPASQPVAQAVQQPSYPAQPLVQAPYPPAPTSPTQQAYAYPAQATQVPPPQDQPQPLAGFQQPAPVDPVVQNPTLYPQQPQYPQATNPAPTQYTNPAPAAGVQDQPLSSQPPTMNPPQIQFQQPPQTSEQNQPYNPPTTSQPYVPPQQQPQPQSPSQPM